MQTLFSKARSSSLNTVNSELHSKKCSTPLNRTNRTLTSPSKYSSWRDNTSVKRSSSTRKWDNLLNLRLSPRMRKHLSKRMDSSARSTVNWARQSRTKEWPMKESRMGSQSNISSFHSNSRELKKAVQENLSSESKTYAMKSSQQATSAVQWW